MSIDSLSHISSESGVPIAEVLQRILDTEAAHNCRADDIADLAASGVVIFGLPWAYAVDLAAALLDAGYTVEAAKTMLVDQRRQEIRSVGAIGRALNML